MTDATKEALATKSANWLGMVFGAIETTFKLGVFVIHMIFTGGRGAFEKCRDEWTDLETKPK